MHIEKVIKVNTTISNEYRNMHKCDYVVIFVFQMKDIGVLIFSYFQIDQV